MTEMRCDVLIVGSGTGGCAAAMAACAKGMRVVMTEETDWIGGQLTAQAVPPDEHPWIESFGCTARYRRYRELVRRFYRDHTPLLPAFRDDPRLNPGGGWVSALCHEPQIGWRVLNDMLMPALASGRLDIRLRHVPLSVETSGDTIEGVRVVDLETGAESLIHAGFVVDATELGDVLALSGTEYVVGAESRRSTAEPNAVEGDAQPDNVQGLTWCMALAHDEGSHRVIDRPASYDRWRAYKPEFWPGPHLGFDVLHPHTGEIRRMPFMSDSWYALLPYRQIVSPDRFAPGYHPHPVTIANWPQNDYFIQSIIDVPRETGKEIDLTYRAKCPGASGESSAAALGEARDLSRSLLYWLQTEAPRHDGGAGYPGLYLRPDITGTSDGLAKSPYIRESRRIVARHTVKEQDVAAYTNPGLDRAPEMPGSVGIGAYRIDLHPSTNGTSTIDTSTLPFQIPLGSLVPIRMRNLIPGAKNLGVTHITNGCYRLHPVEWNIGEAAGTLAAFCVSQATEPMAVVESPAATEELQKWLRADGVEIEWPRLRAL